MILGSKVPGLLSLSLLMLLSFPTSQSAPDESESRRNRQRTSDPVSSFFSELGDLILDVDQTIAVRSQPKIERESNIVSQLFRPRTDYFNRIQRNYGDMQKRLGKFIGNTIGFKNTYSDHELSTVNPPLDFVPTIKPDYNPFAAAAEARKEKLKQRISKGSNENLNKNPFELFFGPQGSIPESVPETFKALEKLSKTIIDDIGDISRESASRSHSKENVSHKGKPEHLPFLEECSSEELKDPDLEQRRQEKCSRIAAEERARSDLRKLMSEVRRANEVLLSESSKTLEKLSESILGRSDESLIEKGTVSINKNETETRGDDTEASRDECLREILDDVPLENIRKERCARIVAEDKLIKDLKKLLIDPKRTSERLIPVSSKAIDNLSSILTKRGGDVEVENMGDTLNSVSSFDKQIRQLIKDHGSWILDYPLIKLWRQRDGSSEDVITTDLNFEDMNTTTIESTSHVPEIEPTEVYVSVSTEHERALQKSGETVPESPHESSYYRIVNEDGDVVTEEIEIVLEPESLEHDIQAAQFERQEPKETVILAFTSDGVPLKLRLGPEIDNPLQYLHKVLQSASVSLNIPVESYNDLEPVGKEVLKLGSGILTRAVLINASDPNELKSLLKALMVSKSSGKTII